MKYKIFRNFSVFLSKVSLYVVDVQNVIVVSKQEKKGFKIQLKRSSAQCISYLCMSPCVPLQACDRRNYRLALSLIPYRFDIYEPLNRMSSRIVQVVAAS